MNSPIRFDQMLMFMIKFQQMLKLELLPPIPSHLHLPQNLSEHISRALNTLQTISYTDYQMGTYKALSNVAMTLSDMFRVIVLQQVFQQVQHQYPDFTNEALACVRHLIMTLDGLYMVFPRDTDTYTDANTEADIDDTHALVTFDLVISLCEMLQYSPSVITFIDEITVTPWCQNRLKMFRIPSDYINGRLLAISGFKNERPLLCLKGVKSYSVDQYGQSYVVIR